MQLRLTIVPIFAAALLLTVQPALAQQTGNTGANATGTGATNTTGNTANTGNTGNTTGGGTTAGGSANADQAFSQIERGTTVGATASTGAGFNDIGGAASGVRSAGGLGGFGGFGGGGGFGGLGGLGGLFGNANASTSTKPVIRTRLRSAIEVTPRTSTQIQRSATQRMVTLPSHSRIPGVNIRVENGDAILEGVVGTEKDRRMSELLLRLEPGVKTIENRISLSPSFE
ncbi:BON domain-containing protein [Novipirellula sp. SH528]|uniref:BON domain-containing protein n=1 Tax=Novipirellula sp. SH528 TaxID=3454466 RepID=UPI003F9F10B9